MLGRFGDDAYSGFRLDFLFYRVSVGVLQRERRDFAEQDTHFAIFDYLSLPSIVEREC